MILMSLINFVIWLYIFAGYRISGRVTKVGKAGKNNWMVIAVFTAIGLFQLVNYLGYISYVFLFSFVMAGIALSLIRSGLAPKGIVVYGRYYRYERIESVTYELNGYELRMIFRYRNRDLYLYLHRDDEKMVKQFIIDFNKGR